MERKNWTKEEIEYLKENYANELNKDLVKIMGLSHNQIIMKSYKLGIKKSKETLEKGYKKNSERMKLNNPMKREEVSKKCGITMKKKYISGNIINYWKGKKSPHLTKRNLENNPMKNKESIEKMKKSLREGYKNGKLKAWCEGIGKKEFKKHQFGGKIWNEGKTHLEDKRIVHGERVNTFNNWSSTEPHDRKFVKAFKKNIKERDGCCMLCNISFNDLHLLKRRIDIHHINYNKRLTIPQNCISLCHSCHSKTNINRNHWNKFFQSLLSERYNYKYSENGEIILELKNEK